MSADTPSYAAIARAMHCPVGSLGPTRKRALERLRHSPIVATLVAN
jgi:DNA-directed RNA polymerase specialized sigma24 family protein